MYNPPHFTIQEMEAMHQFIEENSFGILFAPVAGRPFATHLLLVLEAGRGERGCLTGHFARANPHWRELDGAEVLRIFHCPHAYISPSWYAETEAVPTWNYVAVHVYGICRLVKDDSVLRSMLTRMVRHYEPDSPLAAGWTRSSM